MYTEAYLSTYYLRPEIQITTSSTKIPIRSRFKFSLTIRLPEIKVP